MTIYKILFCLFISARCFGQSATNDTINKFDVNGFKTGKWITRWVESKKTASVEYFIAGKRNGLCIYFTVDGFIIEESEYVNDTLHGVSKVYSKTGTLREIAEFKQGRREGVTKIYNYKKQLVEDYEYHNNMLNGVHRTYYTNGRVATETAYINGKENGTRKTYKNSEHKEVILETDFVDDIRTERRHYKNGKLTKEEKFSYEEELKKDKELRAQNKKVDG